MQNDFEFVFERHNEGQAIPICPITLDEMQFGIQFKNDPNWYDVNAAHAYLCVYKRNDSPLTRQAWLEINRYCQFDINALPNDKIRATRRLGQINQALQLFHVNVEPAFDSLSACFVFFAFAFIGEIVRQQQSGHVPDPRLIYAEFMALAMGVNCLMNSSFVQRPLRNVYYGRGFFQERAAVEPSPEHQILAMQNNLS